MAFGNLKSIEEIEIEFTEKVTLIYGQNGMGKTTILESISLLGHLPTMRQIILDTTGKPRMKDSLLLQMLLDGQLIENAYVDEEKTITEKYPISKTCFNEIIKQIKTKLTLTDEREFSDCLFKRIKLRRPDKNNEETISDGLISFEVSFRKKCDKDEKFNFLVFFRNVNDISITKTLGRKSFNDILMNDTYALIWEEKYNPKMLPLLDHLSKKTKFLIPRDKSSATKKDNLLKLVKHKEHNSEIEDLNLQMAKNTKENIGFTFYLNTDLNDFGRGRDVRESVKDIFGDFTDEWVERLGINFTKDSIKTGVEDLPANNIENLIETKVFSNKKGLQVILNRILTPTNLINQIWGDHDDFKLSDCSINKNEEGKWEPFIRVSRYNKRDVKLDYLSAGENECFFIFMYLLGTNINNSICLLDEPDLHLSQFSKKPFYESLYKLLARKNEFGEDKNCQVIISTHSGSAYSDSEITERLYARKGKNDIRHKTKHNIIYSFKLARQYLQISFGVLGWTVTIYAIALAGGAALVSDIWTAFDGNDAKAHEKILHLIVFPTFYVLGGWHFWKCISFVKRKLSLLE